MAVVDHREQLRNIQTFPSLVRFLRDELDWPVESDDFEELTFEYTPEELGIDAANAAQINEIKRLRPLVANQPWGIFFVKFEPKRLPVVALRRILAGVVVKKRATASAAEQPKWAEDDLLFISNYGEGHERRISFAHFSRDPAKSDLPTLRVVAWDELDTPLHLDHTADLLVERLAWPQPGVEADAAAWRARWRSAFELEHREVITTSRRLAVRLAELARRIRAETLRVLAIETRDGKVTQLMDAFRESLIHDLDADGFADMYAQTIAYGLLSARMANPHVGTADDLAHHMHTNPFLRELMETFLHVGGRSAKSASTIDFDELGVSEVVRLLDSVNMESVVRDFGDRNPLEDPVIHFYELFLSEYDAKKRIQRGVFYTPRPIVSLIVRSVDDLLRSRFKLVDGLADTTTWREMVDRLEGLSIPDGVDMDSAFVQILDPAAGTGTFLVEIIDLVHQRMRDKWKATGASDEDLRVLWRDYVEKDLLPRLHGFELMMAPYAIAHMKVGLKLYETGYEFEGLERAGVYLTDALEPENDFSDRLEFAVPALAHEARAVNRVKRETCFTVVLGNPPYLRERESHSQRTGDRIGGWVRFGGPHGRHALFDDFIDPLAATGASVHAKLAYELSVMFWRLGLWLVFEKLPSPGIVGFVSPRAYLAGPGHAGMRRVMCERSDEIWITDLGGDNRGARKSENVFEIETGVTIGICSGVSRRDACAVGYRELLGTASEKLGALLSASTVASTDFVAAAGADGLFLPASSVQWESWPALTDIFPWQHSGSQFKRLWPIGESDEVLRQRWERLLELEPTERIEAFVETRDRKATASPNGRASKKFTGIARLESNVATPRILRYAYRSFDRQWCLADERLADFLRPSLVSVLGPRQVFATTLMSKQLGHGPAVTVTNLLPDMDVFCNRGAKDVVPLWRDAAGQEPNVAAGFLAVVAEHLGLDEVKPEEIFAYCTAILGGPAYVERFHADLSIPGPRIPMTADNRLFFSGVELGTKLVWLHTYGEAVLNPDVALPSVIEGQAHIVSPISEAPADYPDSFQYDSDQSELHVGDGVIGGVAPEVFGLSISGFRPVESWLRYRMRRRGGRAGREASRTVLDEVRPESWCFTDELLALLRVVEACTSLWPELESFLSEVCGGPLIQGSALPLPTDAQRRAPEAAAEGVRGFV